MLRRAAESADGSHFRSLVMFLPCEIVGSFVSRGSLLAQTEAAVRELTPFQQFLSSPFLLLGGLMALFYIVVMVPERRRKVEEATKLSAIKKNDRIVTIGGIHGVVASIGDTDTLVIRLDESGTARMKIDRKAVARVIAEPAEPASVKE
jgi:preprotein translocase subunit YajC